MGIEVLLADSPEPGGDNLKCWSDPDIRIGDANYSCSMLGHEPLGLCTKHHTDVTGVDLGIEDASTTADRKWGGWFGFGIPIPINHGTENT